SLWRSPSPLPSQDWSWPRNLPEAICSAFTSRPWRTTPTWPPPVPATRRCWRAFPRPAPGCCRSCRRGPGWRGGPPAAAPAADRWFQLQAAQASGEQAALEFSAAQQELILRSAEAYFAVLRAQDALAAVKAEEAALKRQLDQAKERFEVGLSDRTDVLQAQAGYDSAHAGRLLAERQVQDAFENLEALTARPYRRLDGIRHSLPVLAPVPNDA